MATTKNNNFIGNLQYYLKNKKFVFNHLLISTSDVITKRENEWWKVYDYKTVLNRKIL